MTAQKKKEDYEVLDRKFSDIEKQNDAIRKYNTELTHKIDILEKRYDELKKEYLKVVSVLWER